jgi:hypothetical protein
MKDVSEESFVENFSIISRKFSFHFFESPHNFNSTTHNFSTKNCLIFYFNPHEYRKTLRWVLFKIFPRVLFLSSFQLLHLPLTRQKTTKTSQFVKHELCFKDLIMCKHQTLISSLVDWWPFFSLKYLFISQTKLFSV